MNYKWPGIAAAVILAACTSTTVQLPRNALTDPRVANVLHAINNGEVQVGELAVERATDARVRQFAQKMVDEHTTANQRLAVIAVTDAVTDPMATSLQRNTQQTLTSLQTYGAAAFDREYVANQVAMHSWVLQNLDGTLIPSARSARLRLLLTETRVSVAEHLRVAQELQGLFLAPDRNSP